MPSDNEHPDDYSDYVRSYLARPMFLMTGGDLRVFSMLGDRTAVGLIKALYPDWQLDVLLLQKIVNAMGAALEYPAHIERVSDRVPAVTDCLLQVLMEKARTPEEKEMVQSAAEMVRRYVAAGIRKG